MFAKPLLVHILILITFIGYSVFLWLPRHASSEAKTLVSLSQNLGLPFFPQEAVADVKSQAFGGKAVKVGLQVGHWNNNELPSELLSIKGNTGAQAGPFTELQSNMAIATRTKQILEEKGVTVELLPATVPKDYTADAFISIHADGSPSAEVSGFKIASPWNDRTGKASRLAQLLESEYGFQTKMRNDKKNTTANMRDYYAFAHHRFEHSIDINTPGAIVETGFITSPRDRELISHDPHVPANAIASGILLFLEEIN